MELKKQNSYLEAENIFWVEFPPIAFHEQFASFTFY